MIICVCSFTEKGDNLIATLFQDWDGYQAEIKDHKMGLEEFVGNCFDRHLPILFVGACGIAVRAIAPFVEDKTKDSPVLVMDELGKHVIPILSGHLGGANELAYAIADKIKAEPVITTATDIEKRFAVDVFAKKNGFKIRNKNGIKEVSSKILKEETITVSIEPGIEYDYEQIPDFIKIVEYPPRKRVDLLMVLPKERKLEVELLEKSYENGALVLEAMDLVAGIGCRKGKDAESLIGFLERHLVSIDDRYTDLLQRIGAICSIDLKKEELGLIELAQFYHIPFYTYSAAELEKVQGQFSSSEFVNEVTGVSNVCERAAVLGAGNGSLVVRKIAWDGMTLAVAKRKMKIKWVY